MRHLDRENGSPIDSHSVTQVLRLSLDSEESQDFHAVLLDLNLAPFLIRDVLSVSVVAFTRLDFQSGGGSCGKRNAQDSG
jgi:hypothetical protein